MKPCTLCNTEKSFDSFYAAPGCKDGKANQCIACVKARARVRHADKRDQIRAYDRERSKLPHRVMARAQQMLREKERDPQRHKARIAVGNAVRDGRLRKMDCAFCGASKTVAHHHDYARPLDVTWLCSPCHARYHALETMAKSAELPA